MPFLDSPFNRATFIARNSVGGKDIPPRPTPSPRFHPFKKFVSPHIPITSSSSLAHRQILSSPHGSSSSSSVVPSHQHSYTVPSSRSSPLHPAVHPPLPHTSPITPPAISPHIPINLYGQTDSRHIIPRKPQSDRVIQPSPFRPRVAAADRLFAWETPHSIRHRQSLEQSLPPPLVNSAFMAIRGALAPNTRTTYAAGVMRFTQFCDRWDIDEEARMPASYALLCAFIGEYKGKQAGGTIRSWMAGIRGWHHANHAPWYGDDEWVHLARISANKEGTQHKRTVRAPVSIEHLVALRRAITLSDPFHAAVWAVALCTFFGCRRLGETTVSVGAAFDSKYHVIRGVPYVILFLLAIITYPVIQYPFPRAT